MRECRCLNLHSHPEPTKGCCEGCMMCCGYTTPAMVELLIAALVIVSDVYSIILIARNPHSAWRIIVCLIVFILTSAYGAAVSWAYYAIIFTSPGFVPHETWQHPPTYVGPPHLLREPLRASVPFSSNKAAATLAQQQQQQEQPVAPTISRRSPNNSGGDLSQRSRSLTPPPSSPPPPPAVQPAHTQMSSVNPLQDGHDANSRKPAQDEGAVVVYCDSVESGNGSRQRCQPPETAAQPMAEESHTVYVGGPTGRHSPYATPNGPHSTVAAATRPVSIPPLNPYQVRTLAHNGSLRYCHACRLYKPDAAHHCSVCGRCVFNFDHHCPFVNNCVGRNNYKIFVLFLLYAGVGATVSGGLMAVTLFAVDKDDIMSKIGWVAVPAVDVVLGLSLFLFYIQHRVLLCNGESTLDSIVRSDDTFQGWRQSLSRPRRTAAENAEMKRLKKERAERHNRTLLGNESPWWRRYLPIPVRTDDNGEDTVPGNI